MNTATTIKVGNGYIYQGVEIKRTVANGKVTFSFEIDMAGIVIESNFKTLKATTSRIDASIGKRSGMFGVCTTTHIVTDGRLTLK
jgi:hypothetical protein